VDIVIGTKDRKRIVELIEGYDKGKPLKLVSEIKDNRSFEELPVVQPSRARAFLKIQEGCDRFCTYCIVPYARGPVKSRGFSNTIDEVNKLIEAGYKEIVLTGVHIGTYGKDLGYQETLFTLIEKLVEVPNLKRLRISSLDPDDISPELLELITENPIICSHYHIPLQSGDDHILQRMGRRYTTLEYQQLIDSIRAKRPNAAITTDVITGFPGETDEHFGNTANFIKNIAFADLHVFKYSPRRGTPAAGYTGQVPEKIKADRSNYLMAMTQELWQEYASRFLGTTGQVLIEIASDGLWEGHTDNYLKVRFPLTAGDLSGTLVPVRLEKLSREKFIMGELEGGDRNG